MAIRGGIDDVRRTSVHEAAHAVAALVSGYQVNGIEMTTSGGVEVAFARIVFPSADLAAPEHALDNAVIFAMGMAAEMSFFGTHTESDNVADNADLAQLARTGADPLEAYRLALELVAERKDVIDALARALAAKRSLTAVEVLALAP